MRMPKLSCHKATGQARVRLNGRDFYCGTFGSAQADLRYLELLRQYRAGELPAAPPAKSAKIPAGESTTPDLTKGSPRTVELLAARYVTDHARVHYRHPDGRPTTEQEGLKRALAWLTRCPEGKLPPDQFGPRALKSIRAAMVESGRLSRKTVNQHIGRIRRMFRWAASEELVRVEVFSALETVQGLQRGRTVAPDHPPRTPVAWEDVEKTLPYLPAPMRALVLVQWHCGARGGELLIMRPCDIDRTSEIWEYTPPTHKGAWRGKERLILLGKEAQAILRPLLQVKAPTEHVFSPRDSRERSGVGDVYDNNAYSKWVRQAAKQAGAKHWSPHMLRHAYGTRVRAVAGIEQARVLLGHASAVTSEIYARADVESVRGIVEQLG